MNRTELESALKRDGVASVSLADARLIWTSRGQFNHWAKSFGVARHKEVGETLTIQHKSAFNPECQRGGPVDSTCTMDEVRMLLSLDGKGFQWLCARCFEAEVNARKVGGFYNHSLWSGPTWKDAKPKPAIQKVLQN